MSQEITTERLCLRMPLMSDADDIVQAVNDIEVTRWLSQLPFPYTRKDAEDFLSRQTSGKTFMICHNSKVIGCIGTVGEFGYWLSRAHWGQGIMTEAADAVLAWHFAQSSDDLISGHALENLRSRRVLLKMGFVDVEEVDRAHQITGELRRQQIMSLNAQDWQARS
ncbi:MAG: GNAT family N-acetyltransferase [Sulfitobacter sp.]